MKRSTLLAALVFVPAMGFAAEGDQVAPVVSQEGGPKILSFEVGTAFQFTRKPFKNGQGYNFAINIPTKSVILGYYYEQVGAQAESNDNNDATSTKADATLPIVSRRHPSAAVSFQVVDFPGCAGHQPGMWNSF